MDVPSLILLVLLFLALAGATLLVDHPRGRALLARSRLYRRLELLEPSELRTDSMLAIGLALLAFAALLTLRLLLGETGIGRWLVPILSIPLALIAVGSMIVGAMLLERANQRER